eukprot:m.61166 g.61166  ORF g.61166 m.61166 type:complete len:543 (-) comp11381_c0_seq2:210-1838(-)
MSKDTREEVEWEKPRAYVNYELSKIAYLTRTQLYFDGVLEICNEASDLYFSFDELRNSDQILFFASLGFLGLSLVVRFVVAIRPLLLGLINTGFELDEKTNESSYDRRKDYRVLYFFGVLWSLIEPHTGQHIINTTLRETGESKYSADKNKYATNANKMKADAESMMYIGLALVLVEDVPEITIDIIYILRSGGNIGNVALFAFTLLFSILHLLRELSQFMFEMKHKKYIPRGRVVQTLQDLDDFSKRRHEIVHDYCSLEITKITDIAAEAPKQDTAELAAYLMKQSKTLKFFSLHQTELGDKHISEIADSFQDNEILLNLFLRGNGIGPVGLHSLTHAMRWNSTLQVLNLESNLINDEAIIPFAKILESNKCLQFLYLCYNQIGERGAQALGEALRKNSILEYLNLKDNNIKDGIKYIAEALKVNQGLHALYLYGNKLGNEGAAYLAEGLRENTVLESLGLECNGIGDEGAAKLAEAFKSNIPLKNIYLQDNFIGKDVVKNFDDIKLRKLSVSGNKGETMVVNKVFQGGVKQSDNPDLVLL